LALTTHLEAFLTKTLENKEKAPATKKGEASQRNQNKI